MNKKFINNQFVFFIEDYIVANKSELVVLLKKEIPGEELILNVSSEIPRDMPYITVTHSDYEIRIAKNRIEFFNNIIDSIDKESIQKIHSFLINNNFPYISNLGIVTRNRYIFEEDEDMNEPFKKLFSDNKIVNTQESSEIRISNIIKQDIKLDKNDVKTNNLISIFSNYQDGKNIICEYDINTKPNKENVWKKQFNNISMFIDYYEKSKNLFFEKLEKEILCDID